MRVWIHFIVFFYYLREMQVSIYEKKKNQEILKMGPLEKRLSFFSPLMKQTETHVVNVFVCSTEIANIFFAQNSLLFLCTVSSLAY